MTQGAKWLGLGSIAVLLFSGCRTLEPYRVDQEAASNINPASTHVQSEPQPQAITNPILLLSTVTATDIGYVDFYAIDSKVHETEHKSVSVFHVVNAEKPKIADLAWSGMHEFVYTHPKGMVFSRQSMAPGPHRFSVVARGANGKPAAKDIPLTVSTGNVQAVYVYVGQNPADAQSDAQSAQILQPGAIVFLPIVIPTMSTVPALFNAFFVGAFPSGRSRDAEAAYIKTLGDPRWYVQWYALEHLAGFCSANAMASVGRFLKSEDRDLRSVAKRAAGSCKAQ